MFFQRLTQQVFGIQKILQQKLFCVWRDFFSSIVAITLRKAPKNWNQQPREVLEKNKRILNY